MAPCSGINDIHFCIVQSSLRDIWTVPVNVDFATLLFYVVSRSCTVLCEYMQWYDMSSCPPTRHHYLPAALVSSVWGAAEPDRMSEPPSRDLDWTKPPSAWSPTHGAAVSVTSIWCKGPNRQSLFAEDHVHLNSWGLQKYAFCVRNPVGSSNTDANESLLP